MKKLTIFILATTFSHFVLAGDVVHLGKKAVTKNELIAALKPKPKIKLRGIRFTAQQEEQQSLAMNIMFAHDSAELTNDALAQLNPLGEALNSEELAPYSFVIDGHTDSTGTEEYNLELSQQRALAVGNYLYANYGVDAQRLVLNGKGEYELYDTADPESGINRRVEVTTIVTQDQ